MSPKISQSKLETTILTVKQDLDSDEGVWSNWTGGLIGGAHVECRVVSIEE